MIMTTLFNNDFVFFKIFIIQFQNLYNQRRSREREQYSSVDKRNISGGRYCNIC